MPYVNFKRGRKRSAPPNPKRATLRNFCRALKKTCGGDHRTSALWLEKELAELWSREDTHIKEIKALSGEVADLNAQLANAHNEISRLHSLGSVG